MKYTEEEIDKQDTPGNSDEGSEMNYKRTTKQRQETGNSD